MTGLPVHAAGEDKVILWVILIYSVSTLHLQRRIHDTIEARYIFT